MLQQENCHPFVWSLYISCVWKFLDSTFPDIFGAYVGPGGNWRNLSTPPTVSDHFHSPLPGMTHPAWPCPPTPVACTEGKPSILLIYKFPRSFNDI